MTGPRVFVRRLCLGGNRLNYVAVAELAEFLRFSVVAQEDNRMLDKIRVGINQAYRKIADRDNYVTAEKVRNAYLGLGMNHETLLAVFR